MPVFVLCGKKELFEERQLVMIVVITEWMKNLFSSQTGKFTEEEMEELRKASGFKPKEILRIYDVFNEITFHGPLMGDDMFLSIPCIANSPLKDRLLLCFGFTQDKTALNFQEFLVGLSAFNAPGQREKKLKTAFKIQDFDNDGLINHSDLVKYLQIITAGTLTMEEVDLMASQVLTESSTDLNQEGLSFADFQRVVAPLDFQTKLLLPI